MRCVREGNDGGVRRQDAAIRPTERLGRASRNAGLTDRSGEALDLDDAPPGDKAQDAEGVA